MTKTHLLFFDIDGTLYNHQKELPSSTKQAIASLKENGHTVAIATGRGPFMYESLRNELNIDSFVSFNGQYAVLNGKQIYKQTLHKESLATLTAFAHQQGHPLVHMDERHMTSTVEDHPHMKEAIASLRLQPNPLVHDPSFHETNGVIQSLLFCLEGEEQAYADAFPDFEFIRWHPYSVDILPKGGSKTRGIEQIGNALHIPLHEVIAFGDGLNDIDMLQSVGKGIAMGNAEPETKTVAYHVTTSVDEDGIHHGLQWLGLLP